MSRDFQILPLTIDEEEFKKIDNRLRNQLVGCMHAHNELTILNRILMFSMNYQAESDELRDSAQTVQMWCFLQVLAAKLVETWNMLNQRFLKAAPEDPAIARLESRYKENLAWLKDYFGTDPLKDNALTLIRDKTAFHYDKLNLEQAASNLAAHENTIYLAAHPANSLYYMGSALVFRTVFTMIADAAKDPKRGTHEERIREGVRITSEDAKYANWHMHILLYGIIKNLLEQAFPASMKTLGDVRIDISDAPDPDTVHLPIFIDIGHS